VIRALAGKPPTIPLFLLLLIASVSGLAAGLVARRLHPSGTGVLDAAREAGREQPGLRRALATRLDPEKATGLALTLALVVIFGGGLVLGALAIVVRESHALAGIDSAVADWGDDHASALSTHGLDVVTSLGETWMAIVVGIAVALADLRITRNRWTAAFLLAVLVGDKLLTSGIKTLVDRVRPDLNPVAHTLGPSFPSGHSSTAAALWAAVALIAVRWLGPRAAAVLTGAAVGIAVAVAASRVLLDVHWLTDVIAGLALGWAWFATCTIAFGGRVLRFGATARAAESAAPAEPERRPAGRAAVMRGAGRARG
jgi:undecaprenyl-diphosphatase